MSERSLAEEILYEKEKHGLTGVDLKKIRGRYHFLITKGNYTATCYVLYDCSDITVVYALRELIYYLEYYIKKEAKK